MAKELNIITLNVPFPPDYGGMIDSYYRIKWLRSAGVKIHLHCFQYGRTPSKELDDICESVYYYPRHAGIYSFFSMMPYIIRSRDSQMLTENLKSNDYPILFDGLHSTFFINHSDLIFRKKFIRTHNIEHLYYKSLGQSEKNFFKKLYFLFEAKKLKLYEAERLNDVNLFTISQHDHRYFLGKNKNSILIPPFHPYEDLICLPGYGEYILYQGDLSVSENSLTARSLIRNVFSKIKYNCIIAGKNPDRSLLKEADGFKNIKIIPDPEQNEMEDLVRKAHINLLPVLTTNGFKLKHLTALFAGRFCLTNSIGATNFEDKSILQIADSHEEMIERIKKLMNKEFTSEMIGVRRYFLEGSFSNLTNSKRMTDLIF